MMKIKLKLISKSNLITLSNRTRDKKIKVIKDLKTKIIFLEKYQPFFFILIMTMIKKIFKFKKKSIKTFSRNINIELIDDDYRRAVQFKKKLKNKDILSLWMGRFFYLKNQIFWC